MIAAGTTVMVLGGFADGIAGTVTRQHPGCLVSAVACAHCPGRVLPTRIDDETSYTGVEGTWTHIARKSELDEGLVWCDTPEPAGGSTHVE